MSASGGRPAPRHKASRVPMGDKISSICSHIEKFQLNPKTFLTAFLHHSSINAAFRRRFWGTVGWASTRRLLMNIKLLAIRIVRLQRPSSGTYPKGSYVNSSDVTVEFFTEAARLARSQTLTSEMPFLYQLLVAKLQANGTPAELDDGDEELAPNDENDQSNLASQSSDIIPADGTNEPAANQPGPTATPLDRLAASEDDPNNQQAANQSSGLTPTPVERLSVTEEDVNEIEGGFYRKSTDPQVRQQVRVETRVPFVRWSPLVQIAGIMDSN
ncbi:hypothetical protein PCASD_08967 [Puccinia coronata f. sp. avenae]|uniref:Uncharacterized protein n=1 Tax=Puccinia coronata f. sp. avenae TaxID=200324 RepID=A0A2N5UKY4_9BASI|nr:hypothetical protein PCASD_08967 [Puccinia coronata f. sp. avenae]